MNSLQTLPPQNLFQNNKIMGVSNTKNPNPNFLIKLYQILETSDFQDIINWSENGKSFIVKNIHDFTEKILPKYYKHNNYSSFIRQLNIYDFHKTRNNNNFHIFQHKNFIKGERKLLKMIKRKNKKERIKFRFFKIQNLGNKSINNSIKKKITKNSLENKLDYLIKNINENYNKQKFLEEKIESLQKKNKDFLIQNINMIQLTISKSEYNKKLEAVIYFILEIIVKKQSLQKGNVENRNDVNNVNNFSEIDNNNIKININNLKDMNKLMMPLFQNKKNLTYINKDNFQNFFNKYIENNKNNSLLNLKEKIPMLITNINCDELSSKNICNKQMNCNNEIDSNNHSNNLFINNINNNSYSEIVKKSLFKNNNVNSMCDGDNFFNDCYNNDLLNKNYCKDFFDLELNSLNDNDLNKSNLNISSFDNSLNNIFEKNDEYCSIDINDNDMNDLNILFEEVK